MSEKEYIERETLLDRIRGTGYAEPIKSDLLVMAVTIPAADVRHVAHGKWVNYGDEYRLDIKCCMCGQRKPILLGNFNFNYCPNCGADMREES